MTALQTDDTLAGLADDLTGTLWRPGTVRYDELALPWNVAVPNRPIAVVEAHTADDVVAAVRFGNDNAVAVSVQATGHGAVEYATPTLQVNTSALRELAIDSTGRARVGAGLTWRDVIAAATPMGFAPLAGSAPGVGVVGFLTGGGIGPLVRTYGVSSDWVTAFDVVTGAGELRRATATENPALFWALRGGKGALGIVTAVEFDLVRLPELLGGCVYFDGADAASVLHTWREWTHTLPEEATSSVAIVRLPDAPIFPPPLAGKTTVAVRYAWTGDPSTGTETFAPMLAAGRVVLGGIGVMPYAEVGSIHNDPVDPMPATESSCVLTGLPAAAVDAVLAMAGPDTECPQIIVELRHLGGAMARERGGASAFTHRDAAYSFMAIGIAAPPVVEVTRRHAAAVLAAMGPWSDGSCLPNFHASNDPAELARKYDRPALERLAELSEVYDPRGVLAGASGVRAAARSR